MPPYDLSKIRELLQAGFDEGDLRDLCFTLPEFRPVYDNLRESDRKAAIIRQILNHADKKHLFPVLLDWAKAQNPAQFARHQPYLLDDQSNPKQFQNNQKSTTARSHPAKKSSSSWLRDPIWQAMGVLVALVALGWSIYAYYAGTREVAPNLMTPEPVTSPAEVIEASPALEIPLPPGGVELLSTPWRLAAESEASEARQGIDPNILLGKTMVRVTYDLHGLNALGGDASAVVFNQFDDTTDNFEWRFVSLADYGQNGKDGLQTVDIPLATFKNNAGDKFLDLAQTVGDLQTRFWAAEPYRVDIYSVIVYPSPATQEPEPPETPTTIPSPMPTSVPTSTATTTPPPATPEIIPNYTPTTTEVNGYRYILVPAGNDPNETPEFWIGVFEVTNAWFATFLNSRNPANQCSTGTVCIDTKASGVRLRRTGGQWVVTEGYENHPVTQVTWHGAADYCAAIEGRLPTSTEWSKAASWHPVTHGVLSYPWGDRSISPDLANYGGQHGGTQPVGSHPNGLSLLGAYDLVGNVWEFVADTTGVNRTSRGGGWNTPESQINAGSSRQEQDRVTRDDLGFRCAR